MKQKKTERELIEKVKCQTKGCNEKSQAIINKKFHCKGCVDRKKLSEFQRIYFDKARMLQLGK